MESDVVVMHSINIWFSLHVEESYASTKQRQNHSIRSESGKSFNSQLQCELSILLFFP